MIFFLIVLALISFKPYLNNSFPYTHDGENHLARFANYKIAIREGQFPPRFAPNLLNHYGYPVFNYNYPLANILSLPFSFLKINYEITFKIIAFSFVLAGLIGLNKWLKTLGYKQRSRTFASAIFALTPYLINTLSYRGNIGEVMAFCLLPWLFYFVENPIKKPFGKNSVKFLSQTITLIMFFLSHNIAVLFGTPILIIYSLIKYKKGILKQISLISSFIFGIITTLWFWLPAVFEKNLIILDNAELSKSYVDHFSTLAQLLFAPLEFGFSKVGSIDSLSFSIGLVQIFILIFAFILLKKKIKNNKDKQLNKTKLFLGATLTLILLQLSITLPLWRILPLVNFIQFPWRLTMFSGILFLPLAAFVFEKGNKLTQAILLSLIFIQLVTVLKVKPADYFHKNNVDYEAFTQTTSTANENLPKTFLYSDFADWQPSAKILSGKGTITTTEWRGSKRNYTVNVSTDSIIVEPTMYFKGWETKANGTDISYLDNEEIKGRIAYKLPPGKYIINSKFTQNTWPRIIGNVLSGIGIFSLLILVSVSQISKIKNAIKK